MITQAEKVFYSMLGVIMVMASYLYVPTFAETMVTDQYQPQIDTLNDQVFNITVKVNSSGNGTVKFIYQGDGIINSPNPINETGTIAVNFTRLSQSFVDESDFSANWTYIVNNLTILNNSMLANGLRIDNLNSSLISNWTYIVSLNSNLSNYWKLNNSNIDNGTNRFTGSNTFANNTTFTSAGFTRISNLSWEPSNKQWGKVDTFLRDNVTVKCGQNPCQVYVIAYLAGGTLGRTQLRANYTFAGSAQTEVVLTSAPIASEVDDIVSIPIDPFSTAKFYFRFGTGSGATGQINRVHVVDYGANNITIT